MSRLGIRSLLLCSGCHLLAPGGGDDGWVELLDGDSLDGWEPNENPQSWRVEDGAIVANGTRSHLFYMREVARIAWERQAAE